MSKYEILYIIRPNIDDEAKSALVTRFDEILKDNGATLVESKDWEKRRLAYEIQNFREGVYHLVNLESEDDAANREFDRLAKINSDILRHMISKVDEFNDGKSALAERKPRGRRRDVAEGVETSGASASVESEVVETSKEA